MMWRYAAAAVGGYLVGSIPTAYLFVRQRRGLDIRTVGTGNVGASNVAVLEGIWGTVIVGVLDVLKGLLPPWLALRLGLSLEAACVAAGAAVVGHNWPVWLSFQGGRGGGPTLGALLALFPLGFPWVLGFMAVGKLTGTTAILHLVAVAIVPLLAWSFGVDARATATFVVLAALMVLKRLEGNQRFRLPAGARSRRSVFVNRLFLDRD